MSSIEKERIIADFQRRRRHMMYSFGACLLFIALSLLLKQFADSYPGLFGLTERTWNSLALSQFAVGVLAALRGFNQYRCPVCNHIVRGTDKYYFGVLNNPERCPQCHTRLR
ncbi:MAG: hypothetical protein ABFD97_25915 [Syntrophobacter sp.]